MKASLFGSHIAVLCLCLIIFSNSFKCSIRRLDYCDVELQIACQFALNQEDTFFYCILVLGRSQILFSNWTLNRHKLVSSSIFIFFLIHYIPSAVGPPLTTPSPSHFPFLPYPLLLCFLSENNHAFQGYQMNRQ